MHRKILFYLKKLDKNIEKINDDALWRQLQEGDEEAFSLLFEKYYSILFNYGKTLLPEADTVKDCVQDVFVDVWTYRHKLNDAILVKAYLLSSVRKRIARLRERDRIFNKAKDLDSINFLFDFSIEDHLIASESMAIKANQLNSLMNSLPPRQKEALYLRFHQGLSVEQISEVLNVNYQSSKNLLHRAILQLRKDFTHLSLLFFLSFSLNY